MAAVFELMPALGLCMMRPLGMLMMLPALTASNLGGNLIRNALALAIAIPVLPVYLAAQAPSHALDGWPFYWLLASELTLGFIIGFAAAIPFWAIDIAGHLIDTLRGATMSTIFNPTLGAPSSEFGNVLSQALLVLFLVCGGFNKLLASLYDSFRLLPPGTSIHFRDGMISLLKLNWRQMLDLGIGFALPAVVAMVLADVALGMINRTAPNLNVFFLGMPIKSLLAVLMLVVSFQLGMDNFLRQMLGIEQHVRAITEVLR